MTQISQIITDAYRDNNLIPVTQSPTAAEQTEGLSRLNAFYSSIFGVELGIEMCDWPTPPSRTSPVAARYSRLPQNDDLPDNVWPYPPSNVRLLTKITQDTTVYLESTPSDGARMALADIGSTGNLTLDANGRKIEGALTLTIDPAATGPLEWFYRTDKGEWVRIISFALTDESPLPKEFDDFLILALSIRLAARVGKQAGLARNDIRRMVKKVKTRYRQKVIPTIDSVHKIGRTRANGLYGGGGTGGSLFR
jgi:hypothetical protein